MRWARIIAAGALGIFLTLGLAMVVYEGIQQARAQHVLRPGSVAPDFGAPELSGAVFQLTSLRGRVVVLDFWASGCGPCREELPTLVRLAKENEARNVELVLADQIESDERADVGVYVATQLPPLPVNAHVLFGGAKTFDAYAVHVLPTLYVIDRHGRISAAEVGLTSERELRAIIDGALSAQ